jgi:hypothetical protein
MKAVSQDSHWVLPAWFCGLFFLLYAATAMPGLGWRDAPEFAATTHSFGIAHPAGFPTFSLLTKLFTFLPVGSIPFRITLGAAFFQVLVIYLIFRLIPVLVQRNGVEPESPHGPSVFLASGVIALGFGLTSVVWTNATGIEVYGLNLVFLCLILACALRWINTGRDFWLYVGGLIYGISAGNHATVVFFLPGLLLLVLVHSRQHRLRRLFYLCFYFLVGFSVYLYLPIRAQAGPGFDLGYPINWERFLAHITDRKDAEAHFAATKTGSLFLYHAGIFIWQTVPKVFWILGLPLAIVGMVRSWRRYWAFVLAMVIIALFNVLFFIKWTVPVAFLPALLISFLFIGVGLTALVSKLSVLANSTPRFWLWIGAFFTVLIISAITVQYPDQNRSKAFLSTEAFRGDFESLPPDAICLPSILPFHQMAYQNIYQLRPDVTVVMLSAFVKPKVFKPVFPEWLPLVRVPAEKYSRRTGVDYLKKFIATNLDDKRDIFWQPCSLDEVFHPHLKPSLDMLFQISPEPVKDLSDDEAQALTARLINKIRSEIKEDGFIVDPGLHLYYFDLFFNVSRYLNLKGRPKDGLLLLMTMDNLLGPEGTGSLLTHDESRLYCQLGMLLGDMGYLKEAEERLRVSIALVPHNSVAWTILGKVLLDMQRPEEALKVLTRAAELDPTMPETVFYLGEYYRATGQMEKAEENYLRALSMAEGTTIANSIRDAYQKHFHGDE